MDELLLARLALPHLPKEWPTRPRLLHLMDGIVRVRLTLVTAPVGSGKTTAILQWLTERKKKAAWISLSEQENAPNRFLNYLLMALHIDSLPINYDSLETALTTILNQITAGSLLVLDDYHLIESPVIHQMVGFLVSNLPTSCHIVISSRTVLPFSVSRLRVQREFLEITATELAFTSAESTHFLKQLHTAKLSAEQTHEINRLTEGWAAGLQLISLTLQSNQDIDDALSRFKGSYRPVADYFMEEVFLQQPHEIQQFLLQTAILNELNSSLCNKVTGRTDSQLILEGLESKNLFITSLDTQHQRYRYHTLFVEFLHFRCQQHHQPLLEASHHQAAQWYVDQQQISMAIQHILVGHKFAWAADLIEIQGQILWRNGDFAPLDHWLAAIPIEIITSRPRLILLYLWTLLIKLKLDLIDLYLLHLGNLALDPEIQLELACFQSYLAALRGDLGYILHLAKANSWNISLAGEQLFNLYVLPAIGLSHLLRGEIRPASRIFEEARALHQVPGNSTGVLLVLPGLAVAHYLQGQLQGAFLVCKQLLEHAEFLGTPHTLFHGIAYTLMAQIAYQWNDVDMSEQYIQQGIQLWEKVGNADGIFYSYLQLARVKNARNEQDSVQSLLIKLERLQTSGTPHIAKLAAPMLIKLWLTRNKPSSVAYLIQHDDSSIASARMLIVHARWSEAIALLDKICQESWPQKRIIQTIEALILLAIAHYYLGQATHSQALLEQACDLAESDHHVRVFLDTEILPLLRISSHPYAKRLLRFLQAESQAEALVEGLSERELEILMLVKEGLSSKAIAEELFIAPSTIHWHIHNIYTKLNVHNRTQAVDKAVKLNLFGVELPR